jgi:hypothetical protein
MTINSNSQKKQCPKSLRVGRNLYILAGLLSAFIETTDQFSVVDFLHFVRTKNKYIARRTVEKHFRYMVRGFQSAGTIIRSQNFILHPDRPQKIAVWLSRPRGAC